MIKNYKAFIIKMTAKNSIKNYKKIKKKFLVIFVNKK